MAIVVFVVIQVSMGKEENEYTTGQADRHANYIDESEQLIVAHIPKGDEQVISQHIIGSFHPSESNCMPLANAHIFNKLVKQDR